MFSLVRLRKWSSRKRHLLARCQRAAKQVEPDLQIAIPARAASAFWGRENEFRRGWDSNPRVQSTLD